MERKAGELNSRVHMTEISNFNFVLDLLLIVSIYVLYNIFVLFIIDLIYLVIFIVVFYLYFHKIRMFYL